MRVTATSRLGLSPAQERFALEHDARVGMDAANNEPGVFLYHDDEWATYRWLVDGNGRTLDMATFRRSPPEETGQQTETRQPRFLAKDVR